MNLWQRISRAWARWQEYVRWKLLVVEVLQDYPQVTPHHSLDLSRAGYDRYIQFRYGPHKIPFGSESESIVRWIAHQDWEASLPTADLADIVSQQAAIAKHLPDEPAAVPLDKWRSIQFAPSALKGTARMAEPGKRNMFGEEVD